LPFDHSHLICEFTTSVKVKELMMPHSPDRSCVKSRPFARSVDRVAHNHLSYRVWWFALLILALAAVLIAFPPMLVAQTNEEEKGSQTEEPGAFPWSYKEGEEDTRPMTAERLNALILAVDENAEKLTGQTHWQFTVRDIPVSVVADVGADRMRILVGIAKATEIPPEWIIRMMQANFDSALDARYGIAQGVIWGTFIHPLSPLTNDQFLSGLGQTVNLHRTFGTSFSSGAMTFGGGDSQGIIERQIIEELLKKGEDI